MDATGGAASRKPGRTPLLSPGRQILMEEEVITPPRGAVRPLSLRVHHLGYEQYLNLSRFVFRRTVYGMVVWIVNRILDRRLIC